MDAQAWDERYAAAQVWSTGPNEFVAAALADLPPGRALDLAAGEGRNARWLAALGWQVTAIDFSATAIARGQKLGPAAPGTVDWVVGDVLECALPEGVDLALLSYLQLPPDERRVAVRRAFDALAPGGRLFLVAHDSTNLTEGTGGPQDPAVLYTAADVLEDIDGRGFAVIRAERVPRKVSSTDEHGGEQHRTAYDALVHLQRS